MAQWDIIEDNNNRYFIVMDPMSSKKKIEQRKGTIRGESRVAWMLEKNGENKTEAVCVTEVDPRGSIPTWCVNYLSSYAHSHAVKVKQIMEKTLNT